MNGRRWILKIAVSSIGALALTVQLTAQSSVKTKERNALVHPAATSPIAGIILGPARPVLAPSQPPPSACTHVIPSCQNNPSINCYGGLSTLVDEHSSIIPPGINIPNHSGEYLFF